MPDEFEFFTGEARTPADVQQLKKDAEDKLRATFSRVFSTHDGQTVLDAIGGFVGAKHYKPYPADPNGSLQRESMRSVYWWIVEMARRGKGTNGLDI